MNRFSNNAGAFHIDPVPSQPQMAHCHGFFVKHNMRRRGHGSILKELQMQMLKRLGYDFATCTVDSENQAQITILQQSGWRMLAEFANSKSGGKTMWSSKGQKESFLSLAWMSMIALCIAQAIALILK